MNAALSLGMLQHRMQACLLAGGTIPDEIVDDAIADAGTRMGIYADAYRLRLLEALHNDYPLLLAQIGEEAFDRLGLGYIETQPSTTPSLRWFGRLLPQHLRTAESEPAWADLAAFEWAQGEAFDAADAPAFALAQVAEIPYAAWPGMRPLLHPSVRLPVLGTNAPALAAASAKGEALPALSTATAPAVCLLWRRDLIIHWRSLAEDEAAALQALQAGASFGELCECLVDWIEPDAVALHAASLLKRWIEDGLISDIEY